VRWISPGAEYPDLYVEITTHVPFFLPRKHEKTSHPALFVVISGRNISHVHGGSCCPYYCILHIVREVCHSPLQNKALIPLPPRCTLDAIESPYFSLCHLRHPIIFHIVLPFTNWCRGIPVPQGFQQPYCSFRLHHMSKVPLPHRPSLSH
jgi:hypothetical protein